jgi:hypothetical protein
VETPADFDARLAEQVRSLTLPQRAYYLAEYSRGLDALLERLSRARALLALEMRSPPASLTLGEAARLLGVGKTRVAQLEEEGRAWAEFDRTV